jgi:hypothetical protein
LLVKEWAPGEADDLKPQLPKVARCRPLLQELDNVLADEDKFRLRQEQTEAVLEGLFEKRRNFAREDWRAKARQVLLRHMLALAERRKPVGGDADKAAALLRDLYKEQALALGMDSATLEGQTRLTQVLESLIRHVAARAGATPADKDYATKIDRHLRATRFVAEKNDLEYAVLLQRVWVEVLERDLQGEAPEEAKKKMAQVPGDLDKKDRQSGSLLDQLRLGEEMALRVWAAALDPQPKSE